MAKLMVAGCSFSDRNHVIKSYGDHLAELIDAEYIHHGAGCGSNARMWRVVTKAVMDGVITSDDLLVVQYTEISRDEMWTASEDSRLSLTPHKPDQLRKIFARDKFEYGGDILRIKPESYQWQIFEHEREFLELHENHHMSVEFSYAQSITQNFNFQHMLHMNNIPTVFLHALGYGGELWEHNYFNFPEYKYTHKILNRLGHALTETDVHHINSAGHKYIADSLIQIITDMKREPE